MQLLTNADPTSSASPDPRVSWLKVSDGHALAPLARTAFGRRAVAYSTNLEGRKLSHEFPVVLWLDQEDADPEELIRALLQGGDPDLDLPHRIVAVWQASDKAPPAPWDFRVTVGLRDGFREDSWEALEALPMLALRDAVCGMKGCGEDRAELLPPGLLAVDQQLLGAGEAALLLRGDGICDALAVLMINLHRPSLETPACIDPQRRLTASDAMTRLLSALAMNLSVLESKGPLALLDRYRMASTPRR